jgi:hypothetical protein
MCFGNTATIDLTAIVPNFTTKSVITVIHKRFHKSRSSKSALWKYKLQIQNIILIEIFWGAINQYVYFISIFLTREQSPFTRPQSRGRGYQFPLRHYGPFSFSHLRQHIVNLLELRWICSPPCITYFLIGVINYHDYLAPIIFTQSFHGTEVINV